MVYYKGAGVVVIREINGLLKLAKKDVESIAFYESPIKLRICDWCSIYYILILLQYAHFCILLYFIVFSTPILIGG